MDALLANAAVPDDPHHHNKWAVRQGLDKQTAKHLTNPGFKDPFHPR